MDIVRCSHCGSPVLWADYADHIEIWHGSWGSIAAPTGMPEFSMLDAMTPRLTELKLENEELMEKVEELRYLVATQDE